MTHTISIPFRHALLFVLCFIPLCALADGSSLNSKTLSDAWSGKADAQYELGLDHESSDESDYDKAFECYSKAAQQNHAQAQCALGYCYMFARGCDYRPDKAAEWFEKAAQQEFAPAQSALARCYANGFGVKKNAQKAFFWQEKAAASGERDAQRELGSYYANGIGTSPDKAKAAHLMSPLSPLSPLSPFGPVSP